MHFITQIKTLIRFHEHKKLITSKLTLQIFTKKKILLTVYFWEHKFPYKKPMSKKNKHPSDKNRQNPFKNKSICLASAIFHNQ